MGLQHTPHLFCAPMKGRMALAYFVILVAPAAAMKNARGLRGGHTSLAHALAQGAANGTGYGHEVDAGLAAIAANSVAMQLVTGKTTLDSILNSDHVGHITTEEAIKRLEGKLPPEVASLVKLSTGKKTVAWSSAQSSGEFSEVSLAKARNILNGMILNSWIELDDKVIECKEFEERNRGTIAQVNADLVRLGSQIADLEKIMGEANNGIEDADRARGIVEQQMEDLFQNYEAIRLVNDAELTKRKSDLAVFNFILNMTACRGSSLLQMPPNVEFCDTSLGFEIHFADPVAQKKLDAMMTPHARAMLHDLFGEMQGADGSADLGFVQTRRQPFNETIAEPPTAAPETVAPQTEPNPEGQWKKCNDGKANCGLLHDTMSLQWGKFKDLVDELTVEMAKNREKYLGEKALLNAQLVMYSNQKAAEMTALSEATAKKNADQGQSADKDIEHRELEHEFKKKMKECDAKISEILFTNICAVKKVRNEVMTFSSVTPPSKISDCDVKDWVPGDCSMMCDDSCPQPDPYACGGWQDLTREIVVAPNSYGIQCPPLARKKKCNQFKCPVNCGLSMWSSWSKCTKDCEGGVQGKTRSVIIRPKNGGDACDTVQEERSCNTGSCDRDCSLHPWTDWSPCSMACSAGIQERVRNVLVPIRGGGKCPEKKNHERFEEKECNAQPCIGDEICIAKQDLIILLDGSGSMRQEGFEILRSFTGNLTDRYQSMYFGEQHMALGVVLFGNGHLEADGTITPALAVSALTNDTAAVKSEINMLQWQRGFTNLAQGFVQAGITLQQGGREEAQAAIVIIWDGKYSFAFETGQKARELKDKNVQIYMASVIETIGEQEGEVTKSWVSFPWDTNFEHVPGLEALENNIDTYTQKLIVKFCPLSYSPSFQEKQDERVGFMMIHMDGQPTGECGNAMRIGARDSVEECAEAARSADGVLAFSYGKRWMAKQCVLEKMEVTTELYNTWLHSRENPPCPGGEWMMNPGFDTYAIEPPSELEAR